MLKPVKRTALDGKVWWVVWDTDQKKYCTLVCLAGKYRTKKACQFDIDWHTAHSKHDFEEKVWIRVI